MLLPREFFTLVSTHVEGPLQFQGYKAIYARSTLVLLSRKTSTPLAALVLKPDDCGVKAVFTQRPSPIYDVNRTYIQGLFDLSDQPFQFGLANLTDLGYLNINVLHTEHKVNSTDPGPAYGVNAWNEFQCNQGGWIACDQRTSRAMVLAGRVSATTGSAVTVAETESKVEHKDQGLYFHLSVTPQSEIPALQALFDEGPPVWVPAATLVRTVKAPIARGRGGYMEERGRASQGITGHLLGSRGRGAREDEYLDSEEEGDVEYGNESFMEEDLHFLGGPRDAAPMGALPMPVTGELQREGGERRRMDASTNERSASMRAVRNQVDEVHALSPDAMSALRNQSATIPERGAVQVQGLARRFLSSTDEIPSSPPSTLSLTSTSVDRGTKRKSALFRPVDVGQSQAGRLTYGEHRTVNTVATNVDYDFERSATGTVLCLSIFSGLTLFPLPDLDAMARQQITDYVEQKNLDLVAALTRVFVSDQCTICLDAPPDTVCAHCGHQAMCGACTKGFTQSSCPLCRAPIAALVHVANVQ